MADRFQIIGKYEALKKELHGKLINANALRTKFSELTDPLFVDFEDMDFKTITELADQMKDLQVEMEELTKRIDQMASVYNIED